MNVKICFDLAGLKNTYKELNKRKLNIVKELSDIIIYLLEHILKSNAFLILVHFGIKNKQF